LSSYGFDELYNSAFILWGLFCKIAESKKTEAEHSVTAQTVAVVVTFAGFAKGFVMV
jgi:hypothetical protein